MKAKIFCALIAAACLNSTDILSDNVILQRGNVTRLRNIQIYSSRNNIVSGSNHWVSITWRVMGSGTFWGGFVSMYRHNGEYLGLFLPSLFSFDSSYTYWSNKYVGIVGKAILCGDMYCSFTMVESW